MFIYLTVAYILSRTFYNCRSTLSQLNELRRVCYVNRTTVGNVMVDFAPFDT